MMVAIAIFSLMVAMLLPAVQAARASAQRVQCSNNLHNVGVAFAQRRSARPKVVALSPTTWQKELKPFTDSDVIFQCPNSTGKVQSGALACRITHGGWPVQSIPLLPGPRCQQHNTTPNSYELWVEDWNNWDFRDLRLLIEHLPSGEEKVTITLVDSSSTFDIMSEDGTVLLPGIDKHNWRGKSCVVAGASASYGINGRSGGFSVLDSHKVLLLDYTKPIANVVGADASDQFSAAVAPRHGGHCNVLFIDGSVNSFDPSEIDPADLAIHDSLWKPKADRPLRPQ